MITLNEAVRQMTRIAMAEPERVNPVDDADTCLYTVPPEDVRWVQPENHGKHCIAGEFLAQNNFPVPDWTVIEPFSDVVEHLDNPEVFDEQAVTFIGALQRVADGAVIYDLPYDGGMPRPWGIVANYIDHARREALGEQMENPDD